jgi:murein DD-endopeptidase MepM/ murein hydrolase activator NlpD
LLVLLAGCLKTQPPAPVVLYGTSQGEGSAGVHNVVAGDTIYSVSERYDIVMQNIVTYNDLSAPFKLHVGQRLRLPPPERYTVREGDTLYEVSRIFEVSTNDLARVNRLTPPYAITRGQVLTLPSLVSAPQAEPSTVAIEQAPSAPVALVAEVTSGESLEAEPVVFKPSSVVGMPEVAQKATPPAKITSKTPARAGGKFLKPAEGKILSSYGPKGGGLHNDGINIAAPVGSPVVAAENGVVVYVGDELKGSGNLILVRHADRWMSAYAHLDQTVVTRGQEIIRGQKIGTVGSTGTVTEPQLHFELRRGTQAVNPDRYM